MVSEKSRVGEKSVGGPAEEEEEKTLLIGLS